MGDPLAHAVAYRVLEIGIATVRAMIDQASTHGIDSVANAPPELVTWLRARFDGRQSLPRLAPRHA